MVDISNNLRPGNGVDLLGGRIDAVVAKQRSLVDLWWCSAT
jgi:hypothetical protein